MPQQHWVRSVPRLCLEPNNNRPSGGRRHGIRLLHEGDNDNGEISNLPDQLIGREVSVPGGAENVRAPRKSRHINVVQILMSAVRRTVAVLRAAAGLDPKNINGLVGAYPV